jgi:hypothetical protein
MDWFIRYRPGMVQGIASFAEPGRGGSHMLSIVDRAKLAQVLSRALDESEFLGEYGLRALSKHHEREPYTFHVDGHAHTVRYEPAESSNFIFGGNSNWRGPIWFPLNFLMIEALRKYHAYFGDSFKIDLPRGSQQSVTLDQAAQEISRRLVSIFLRDESRGGKRAVLGDVDYFQTDPHWRDCVPFYEYFHGDNGAGLGASHQTGWTALVASLIQAGFDQAPPGRPGINRTGSAG